MTTLPTHINQLVATKLGKDYREITEVRHIPLSGLLANQVLVKNHYAGINASDINITSGAYSKDLVFPLPVGVEGVGEVVACGAGVSHVKEGDHLLYLGFGKGSFADYTVVDANPGFSFRVENSHPELLALITGATTAAVGLLRVGELRPGKDTVLVTGAAGATGQFAVQIAKMHGNHVIAVCGGKEKAQFVKELGADRVVNYREEELSEVLSKEYPKGVDVFYEGIGGKMFDDCLDNLAFGGRLLVVGYISEYQNEQPEVVSQPRVYSKLLWKGASIRAYLSNQYPEEFQTQLVKMYEAWDRGALRSRLDSKEFVGLGSVPDALEHLYSGKNLGKVYVSL